MGYQPPPVETYRWHDGTQHCGGCHDLITAYDVSCPHCGKRFTRRSPLKFGGYTSRDMLPGKVEFDHAIKLREMIEQTTRNPGTATLVEGIEMLKQEYAFLNSLRRRMEEP